MDTRRVSAAAGFILLMGCIVGVVVVIYRGGSARSSYKSTVEESWKKRETRTKEKIELGPFVSEPSAQEAKLLAEELQRLFIKNTSPGENLGDGTGDDGKGKEVMGPKNEKSSNAKSLSPNKIPPVVMNLPTLPNHPTSPAAEKVLPSSERNDRERKVPGGSQETQGNEIISHEESRRPTVGEPVVKNEVYETPKIPSISPRLQQIAHRHMPSTTNRDTRDRLVVPSLPSALYPGGPPTSRHPSVSMSPEIYSGSSSNLSDNIKRQRDDTSSQLSSSDNKFSQSSSWEDDALLDEEDELFDDYDQQYLLEDEDVDPFRDPLKEMGHLFELASTFYKTGINATNLNGILRVINETVQRGNNSGLLTQLNELYSRPGIGTTSPLLPSDSNTLGRNAYETSLTAFVFMSFGIFLLNQIHNFAGDEVGLNGVGQGRSLDSNTLEESELDVLFQPPQAHDNNGSENGTFEDPGTKFGVSRAQSKDQDESRGRGTLKELPGESPDVPDYVNNMFRAALNLVNAYTKDSQALECIWSLYCQDLDKTAGKQSSLYSLAARINSIGLRLIMGQIPTELTPDVMLRSLLAWDGLPCKKYFPKCKVDGETVSLQNKEAISGNRTSLQMT